MSGVSTARRHSRRSAAAPIVLTTVRVLLGPAVVLLAYAGVRGWPMAACIIAALLSDFFDGVLARKLNVVTAVLRRYDSIADTVFYVGVLVAVWHLERSVVFRFKWLLVPLVLLEIIRIAVECARFGHMAAYHLWSSKAWGLVLALSTIALLGYGVAGPLLTLALAAGIICDSEGLAISLVLSNPKHDVRTVFHALRG